MYPPTFFSRAFPRCHLSQIRIKCYWTALNGYIIQTLLDIVNITSSSSSSLSYIFSVECAIYGIDLHPNGERFATVGGGKLNHFKLICNQ